MASDADGNVYVADWLGGIRKISSSGSVSTLHVAGIRFDRVTGVTVPSDASAKGTLFASDAQGLVRIDVRHLVATRLYSFPSGTDSLSTPSVSSDVPLGVPHSVAALNGGDIVFTDLRDSAVKYLRFGSFLRYLGRTPSENAMITGGGPGFDAGAPEYDAPMGIAVDSQGVTYVADTGNKRIVRIDPFDIKTWITEAELSQLKFPENHYRIGVLGSSFTWWASDVDHSIAGFLEKRLRADPELASSPAATQYFQVSLRGEFDLIDNVLSAGSVDAVVQLISPIDPYGLGLGNDESAWGNYLRTRVVQSAKTLAVAGIPYLVVINPASNTLSPF